MLTADSEIANTAGFGKLAALAGVRDFPSRVKCASLCWHTLIAALDQQPGLCRPSKRLGSRMYSREQRTVYAQPRSRSRIDPGRRHRAICRWARLVTLLSLWVAASPSMLTAACFESPAADADALGKEPPESAGIAAPMHHGRTWKPLSGHSSGPAMTRKSPSILSISASFTAANLTKTTEHERHRFCTDDPHRTRLRHG